MMKKQFEVQKKPEITTQHTVMLYLQFSTNSPFWDLIHSIDEVRFHDSPTIWDGIISHALSEGKKVRIRREVITKTNSTVYFIKEIKNEMANA